MNRIENWNTGRLAIIGALTGMIYLFLSEKLWELPMQAMFASLVGGAIGGATLFAFVSGLRNLLVK